MAEGRGQAVVGGRFKGKKIEAGKRLGAVIIWIRLARCS